MRIVIDLQCAQSCSKNRKIGRFAIALVNAIAEQTKSHELSLLLNEAFPESARFLRARLKGLVPQDSIHTFDPPQPVSADNVNNSWRTNAAELLREHYLEKLAPDMVLVLYLFEGYCDDAVVSVGRNALGDRTAVMLCEPDTWLGADQHSRSASFHRYYQRRLRSLANAGLVISLFECAQRGEVNLSRWCKGRMERIECSMDAKTSDGCKDGADIVNDGEQGGEKKCPVSGIARRVLGVLEAHHKARSDMCESGGAKKHCRKRLAYVSPMPPEKTGIADYSAELIRELAHYYDIDVITAQAEVSGDWVSTCFAIRGVAYFEAHADEYDRILYQLGNNPVHQFIFDLVERYPGVVDLHDVFLAHAQASGSRPFPEVLYESHGYSAVQRLSETGQEHCLWEYPVNTRVVEAATGVIVRSRHAKQIGTQWHGREVAQRWALVPHPRRVMPAVDKHDARRRLKVSEQVFLVCSFGFVNRAKLCDRVVRAWSGSELGRDKNCHLVFVGARDDGCYGAEFNDVIRSTGMKDRIQLTDFVSQDQYRWWLAAADCAVQLRSRSRGETSGAILDCLAGGVPLIFNAHGSAEELSDRAGVKLSDNFTDEELGESLELVRGSPDVRQRSTSYGVNYIRDHHNPRVSGRLYRDVIENAMDGTNGGNERWLLKSIAQIAAPATPDLYDLSRLSLAIARTRHKSKLQFLVDVSAIARADLKTGVQRVVRAQLSEMIRTPPEGYRIEPVYLSHTGGVCHYRYARRYTLSLLNEASDSLRDEAVDPGLGDIFYAPDLCVGDVIQAENAGLYRRWRARGVEIYFLIHDLLPLQHPGWFPEGVAGNHERWFNAIAHEANGLICVSDSVAGEVRKRMALRRTSRPDEPRIACVPHGANMEASFASDGVPDSASAVRYALSRRPTFLMVGTIEPRKGHRQVIHAFDVLWERGHDVNLVIVGCEGWGSVRDGGSGDIPRLVARLRNHAESGNRLLWLEGISDEYLEKVYESSTCLISASEGEGFGLPLIEAARHSVPIIARDIPVFREVAGENAFYFRGFEPGDVADSVEAWRQLYNTGKHPCSTKMTWINWSTNVDRLKAFIFNENVDG